MMSLLFAQNAEIVQAAQVVEATEAEFSLLNQLTYGRILTALIVMTVAFVVVKLSDRGFEALASAAPRARFLFKGLIPVVRFLVTLIAALAIIRIFAPTPQAMVAVAASAGLALGFGAQDLIKNIIGGIIILTDRPYQLGDKVLIGDAYGEIDHIGLRSTKMTNADDTRITIPNAEILNGRVWNSNSGVPDAQVGTELFLPASSDPHDVIRIATEAALTSPYLFPDKPVAVLISDEFDQKPYIKVKIKAYVYDHRLESKMKSDITVRAKSEFLKQGLMDAWS